jgi:putative effector of murein hydrolase
MGFNKFLVNSIAELWICNLILLTMASIDYFISENYMKAVLCVSFVLLNCIVAICVRIYGSRDKEEE